MKKTITLLLVFFTGLLSAQTINIQGNPYGGNPYASVTAALAASTSASDVILISGTITESIDITKSITLRGSNPLTDIIQANAAPLTASTRVITLTGTPPTALNITIENLGIRHGNITGANGGGINVDKITGLVTLKNLIIENNKTTTNGGALGIAGSNVDIVECTIKNNTATLDGGAIIAAPNNAALIDNVVNIKQSLLNANVGRNGGAIYINGNLNSGNTYKIAVNIENSTISNNTTTSAGTGNGGGAILSLSQPWITTPSIGNVTLRLVHTTTYNNAHLSPAKAGIQFLAPTTTAPTNFSAYNSILVNTDVVATKSLNCNLVNITNAINTIFGGLEGTVPAIITNVANNNQTGRTATQAGLTGTLTNEGGNTQVIAINGASAAHNYCTVNPGFSPPTIDQTGLTRTGTPDAGAYELAINTTWTGATDTAWTDASNWSNGVPTATSNVAIADVTNQPSIASNVGIKYLEIATGATLDVTSGNLTLSGAVANNGGTMTLENNANLIQGGTTNTNKGKVIVKRNSNALLRLDYTMWSSPVAGQNLAAFSPLTSQSPNRFYTYDAANDVYANVDPLTTSFAPGTGYLIRMPNTADAVIPTAYPGVFTGVPNNGNITLGSVTPLVAGKFYSVGNPYPSSISASSFFTGNTNLGTTLYFWRKTNAVVNGAPGNGTAYATWTNLGGTSSSGNVAPNNLVPNGQIAVGQGFIVNTGTATTINFTNAMRTSTAATFFKTKATTTPDRIWLNLTNATGAFSQTLIGYTADATLGVDNGIDGEYINDSPLALTSNIDNKEYTIQGRPTFDPTDVVALNFKTAIAGDYTIAIDHFDGLFASGQDIFLADSKTGTETDLKAGAYNFTATAGVDNARFTLKYQKTLKVDAPALDENSISVYATNGTLYVNSKSVAISNIQVFDVQGRLIAEQKNLKATTAVFNNLRASDQVLIVKIKGEDNSVVTKKLLN